LREQQDEKGLIGTSAAHTFHYNHAIATMALAEAQVLSDYKLLKRTVQQAVDYIHNARNPYKVWRYYPRAGDNDTSMTVWMTLALLSAKDGGATVGENTLKYVRAWFEEVTNPNDGRVGYTKRGENSSRLADTQQRFPPDRTEALTAASLFVRILMGERPEQSPWMGQAALRIRNKPPIWDEASGDIDMYYWLFGTWAMYQMGGEHWQEWNPKMTKALLGSQRRDEELRGSWDPKGPWGGQGGRVYATAVNVLTLSVYYRLQRLLEEKAAGAAEKKEAAPEAGEKKDK
jgi:hypothetical protein